MSEFPFLFDLSLLDSTAVEIFFNIKADCRFGQKPLSLSILHDGEMTCYKHLRAATFQFFHILFPNCPPHMGKPARKKSYVDFFVHSPGIARQLHH